MNRSMNYSIKKNYFIFLCICIILSEYIIPYFFIGEIIIKNTQDFLDSNFLNTKIIHDFYFKKNIEAPKLILGGSLEWHDYPNIFYIHQILLYYLLGNKFFFINNLLNTLLGFFTFFLFAKKKFNNISKNICLLSGLIYAFIVHNQGEIYQWGLLPYFIYLISCRNNYRFKHFLIVFLIGSFSSLYYAPFVYLYSIFFVILFFNKKFKKDYLILFIIFLTGTILVSLPTLFNLLNNGINYYHRSDFDLKFDIYEVLISGLRQFLFLDLNYNKKNFIFYLPQIFFIWILYFYSLKNYNIKVIQIIIINLLFCLIVINFLNNYIINNVFINLSFLNMHGKLGHFKPFLLSYLFLTLYELLNSYNKKIILLFSLFFVSTYPIQISTYHIINHYLKNSLNQNDFEQIKEEFLQNNYLQSFKRYIVSNKQTYQKKSLRLTTDQTFEGFYRTNDFKLIKKKFIKDDTVISIGIHPSVLAFNNIKVLGGYFNLYPKHYKNSFLKIIENLDKDYVDNFKKYGSIVSINEEFNNLDEEYVSKVKYEEAYKLGAKYVITKYKLKNNNLSKVCLNCTNKFLKQHKINIYKIQN